MTGTRARELAPTLPADLEAMRIATARALAKRGGFGDAEPEGYCDFHLADADVAIAVIAPMVAAKCKEIVQDLGWVLPMFDDPAINQATDDAACSVLAQAVAAIDIAFPPAEWNPALTNHPEEK